MTAQRVVALDIVMKGSVHCLISMTVLSGEIVQPGMVTATRVNWLSLQECTQLAAR